MVAGLSVEGVLDVFSPVTGGHPCEGGNPFRRSVGTRDHLIQAALEPTSRVLVFGEDEKAAVVPSWRCGAGRRQALAHIGFDPIDDLANARIGVVAARLGHIEYLVDKSEFAHQRRLCFRPAAVCRCRGRRRHQIIETQFRRIGSFGIIRLVDLAADFVFMIGRSSHLGVGFRAGGQSFEIGPQGSRDRRGRLRPLQRALHTLPMHRERSCEGLDG